MGYAVLTPRPAPSLRAEFNDRPAPRLPFQKLVELRGKVREPDRIGDPVEMPRLEIRGEALPDLAPQWHRRRPRVDSDQTHAAQDERQHGRVELDPSRVAEARNEAFGLHRAREPGELLASDRIERGGP